MFVQRVCAALFLLALVCIQESLECRDVLLEFKGAYFLPTNSCFKNIYHGGALYGPELTFQFSENHERWYGFMSADFLNKCGRSIGLGNSTKVKIAALVFGVKYFVPFCYGDFYCGLGVQPTQVKTFNCSPFVVARTSQWGCGGIAKVGAYIDMSCNTFLDFFIDYSFVKVGCKNSCCNGSLAVMPLKANASGAIFGAGIGYRFN